MAMMLFGYWFEREGKFVSLEESSRLFDRDEIDSLLKPLYEDQGFKDAFEIVVRGTVFKQGELVEVALGTGEWVKRYLHSAGYVRETNATYVRCYNNDGIVYNWDRIRKC